MINKKLEEAAQKEAWDNFDGDDYAYRGFIAGAKWREENPKLCEWCDRPEVEEFWRDCNGQRICKECYEHR